MRWQCSSAVYDCCALGPDLLSIQRSPPKQLMLDLGDAKGKMQEKIDAVVKALTANEANKCKVGPLLHVLWRSARSLEPGTYHFFVAGGRLNHFLQEFQWNCITSRYA